MWWQKMFWGKRLFQKLNSDGGMILECVIWNVDGRRLLECSDDVTAAAVAARLDARGSTPPPGGFSSEYHFLISDAQYLYLYYYDWHLHWKIRRLLSMGSCPGTKPWGSKATGPWKDDPSVWLLMMLMLIPPG